MFINDLIAAYLKFQARSKKAEFFANKQQKALDTMNQQVSIRDLVVTTPFPYCYGESQKHTNSYTDVSEKERLKDHIQTLMTLANEDHRANNCTETASGSYQLKEGKENSITRLTMNEFSLYTKEPMTNREYSRLLADLTVMAEKLEPNVHILLSSFAVKTYDKVLNLSLFIEGGSPPKIHSFAKNTASKVDIDYSEPSQLFSQQVSGKRVTHHADMISDDSGLLINTGSVFEVTTAGGAVYTQTVDVCLDHALGHSKALLERKIFENASPDEIIPEQIEQCVTSNWIDIKENAVIATSVLHADPIRSMHDFHKAAIGERIIPQAKIDAIKTDKYLAMQVRESNKGYELLNPPFGSNCQVEVLLERPVAHHVPELQSAIQQHNRAQLDSWAKDEDDKTIQRASTSSVIGNRIASLKQDMLNHCRPSLWQRIFKTEEYRQKIEAASIIERSFSLIMPDFKEQKAENLFLLRPWSKDLEFRLARISPEGTHSDCIKTLITDIKTAVNVELGTTLNVEFDQDSPRP